MLWQDIIISISNILFSYALIPQVYHGFKKKKGFITLQTSLLTFVGLYAIAIAFLTFKLYFSMTITAITGTFWVILFLQRLIYGKA
ncbi:MAG TPA: hypothetical protein VJJ53_00540 [Candidatus Nanoarchaeia archaeon]|nr:hypothetical protein [Candidatus Nanoarchaeia archaeon]